MFCSEVVLSLLKLVNSFFKVFLYMYFSPPCKTKTGWSLTKILLFIDAKHLLLNWNYSVFWKYEPSVMFLSCWSFVAIKVELNTGLIRWVHSISFGAPFLCWSVSVSVQQLPKNCESLFQLVPVSLAYEIWNSVGGNNFFWERGTQYSHNSLFVWQS